MTRNRLLCDEMNDPDTSDAYGLGSIWREGHSVSRVSEVIEAMVHAVPARKASLDEVEVARLRELTGELMAAKPEAVAEYARFLGVKQRGLCLPEAELGRRLGGATVMVTGGTGCIGSALMAQLAQRNLGRLVGVSRGVTTSWPRQPDAEYLVGDARDRARMDELIAQVRPDVIFHVAAQRSPALAEVDVHRTVTTNVLGTRNVLYAAAAAGVPQVVCASTGKALRPYSPEMYTASKRAAEWVATTAAASGDLLVSAARFTHVIDNSIVYERLLDWADAGTGADAGTRKRRRPAAQLVDRLLHPVGARIGPAPAARLPGREAA